MKNTIKNIIFRVWSGYVPTETFNKLKFPLCDLLLIQPLKEQRLYFRRRFQIYGTSLTRCKHHPNNFINLFAKTPPKQPKHRFKPKLFFKYPWPISSPTSITYSATSSVAPGVLRKRETVAKGCHCLDYLNVKAKKKAFYRRTQSECYQPD